MKYLILMLLAACPAKKSADAPKDPAPADAGTTDPVAAPLDAAPVVTPGNPFCANRPEKAGPFVLDATLAAQRRGTGAKTYADVDSSKAQPIEVCGMEGARIWLEKTPVPRRQRRGPGRPIRLGRPRRPLRHDDRAVQGGLPRRHAQHRVRGPLLRTRRGDVNERDDQHDHLRR
jgi:hypothetical protein